MTGASLKEDFAAVEANSRLLEQVRNEYTSRYPNQWLAASDGRLFGPTQTSRELRTILDAECANLNTAQAIYFDTDARPYVDLPRISSAQP